MFSRSQEKFATRLTVNGDKINQLNAVKILGCWVQEDAGKWSKNTTELCKAAYARLSMLSKLKYTGVSTEDLLDIYKLFMRSKADICQLSGTVASHKKKNRRLKIFRNLA